MSWSIRDHYTCKYVSLYIVNESAYLHVNYFPSRLGALLSRLATLAPRLDKASSAVNEAQVVAAIESNLDDLEVWLVTSGKFSNNQQILVQIEDHKVCQLSLLVDRLFILKCLVCVFH